MKNLIMLLLSVQPGMVGQKMLQVLAELKFPVNNLYPMASARSAGKEINILMVKNYVVEELCDEAFDKDIDIALFSAGGSTSERFLSSSRKKKA